jgi:DDE superfamily endonuclease/Tc5 transposase DNA-binding domain/helix-turn-helix, Psq domain
MTRPKDIAAAEKEAQLQAAITAVLNKEYTCHTAATVFNVPRRTLYDRVNGMKKARNKAHERDQILTHAEEKVLVRWITRLTITGYPPRYATLLEMAEEIRKQRVKDKVQTVIYDDIGEQWVQRFLRRHPELVSITPRSIDAVRIKDTSSERLKQWFDDLEKVLVEYNIKPENIYNMDESGFAIGEKEPGRCIINAKVRQQFQAKPGRQEWVSVVECICADGTIVPPLVIFKAENLSTQWIPAHIHGHWRFSCNSKGWTSNDHGVRWLKQCFDPTTCQKAAGEYRLLICDGHDSHITGKWIAHCMDNNIILMILPPHSSHLTQPLDVGVFGALKKHMAAEIDPLIRTGVPRIQKVEWLTAFVAAHDRALSEQNIRGGFRGTGIHPFLPSKVLRRVTAPSSPRRETRPSTPTNPPTPFHAAVLTSSPNDYEAVHQANIALGPLLDSGAPLPTLAKTYIKCLSRHAERLFAENTVLKSDYNKQQEVLGARKRRLSGKRQAIDGKHIMTAAEMLAVQAAERVTKQRKVPKREPSQRKGKSKARKDLTDELEEELDASEDEDVEILDCIEVKR